MMRVMNPRGVYKNYLGCIGGEDPKLRASCGLGARRDSGDFLTKESIDQGGFANIWSSDDGDKTRAKGRSHSLLFSYKIGKVCESDETQFTTSLRIFCDQESRHFTI